MTFVEHFNSRDVEGNLIQRKSAEGPINLKHGDKAILRQSDYGIVKTEKLFDPFTQTVASVTSHLMTVHRIKTVYDLHENDDNTFWVEGVHLMRYSEKKDVPAREEPERDSSAKSRIDGIKILATFMVIVTVFAVTLI